MKNIITIVVGFIATLALLGLIGQYFQAEYDAMEDRVAALEQQRDELQGEVNSVTDALSVYQNENASLTDAYEEVKQEMIILQDDRLTTEEEEQSTEEKEPEKSTEKASVEKKDTDNTTMVFSVDKSTTPGAVIDKDFDVYYEVEEEETTTESSTNYTYYGTKQLTAYVATGNACADGVYPTVGYTAACNDPALWHKWVYIEGVGDRYIHDTGGMSSSVIDIFMGSYSEAIQFGRQSANIYVYN